MAAAVPPAGPSESEIYLGSESFRTRGGILKLVAQRHGSPTILACDASDPQCPGRAYRRLYSHRRPFDLDDSQEFGGLDTAAQSNRRYRACHGPPDRHDLTPSIWVGWPLRHRDSRMGHHLCGVAGKPSRRSGRQGPYFRSSGLARDDDHLRALGRRWLIRAVARASGDGGALVLHLIYGAVLGV